MEVELDWSATLKEGMAYALVLVLSWMVDGGALMKMEFTLLLLFRLLVVDVALIAYVEPAELVRGEDGVAKVRLATETVGMTKLSLPEFGRRSHRADGWRGSPWGSW